MNYIKHKVTNPSIIPENRIASADLQPSAPPVFTAPVGVVGDCPGVVVGAAPPPPTNVSIDVVAGNEVELVFPPDAERV